MRQAAATRVLVGVHGGGLAHALWLPDDSALIEMLPHRAAHAGEYRGFQRHEGACYRNVAKSLGACSYFAVPVSVKQDGSVAIPRDKVT